MATYQMGIKCFMRRMFAPVLSGYQADTLHSVDRAWQRHLHAVEKECATIDGELAASARVCARSCAKLRLRKIILMSGLFDADYYLRTYADVRNANAEPLDHYIDFGADEDRKPNRIFNPHYYRRAYLPQANSNPLVHYIREGEALGFKPAEAFDTVAHLLANPDVGAAGISPLWHQLQSAGASAFRRRIDRRAPVYVSKPTSRQWFRPVRGAAGVNFIGPVEVVSGLGTSARGYLDALRAAHVPVNVIPWRLGFEHQKSIRSSFPTTAEPQPINIVHLNADCAYLWLPRLGELLSSRRYNVAVWYWELASFRPEWTDLLARFDEVWCASSFTARGIAAVSPKPVRVVRPAVQFRQPTADISRREFGLADGQYTFFFACDSGSNLTRKNPAALVHAYREEFGPQDGGALLLKLSYATGHSPDVLRLRRLAEGRPDIVFMNRLLSENEFAALMTLVDCYVSPHRSEGLGLTIIEAMFAGKPVIGTRYGGVTDFLMPATGIMLEHSVVEIEETAEPYPAGYVWAEPAISSIRSGMRWVFENRQAACSLGKAGQRFASAMFAPCQTAAGIRHEIDRIWLDHAPPYCRDQT